MPETTKRRKEHDSICFSMICRIMKSLHYKLRKKDPNYVKISIVFLKKKDNVSFLFNFANDSNGLKG